MSKQKILISGCGLSWSGQERKVWSNILRVAGADIVDVGGPAVSNQWILDRAFLAMLEDRSITDAVVQLTGLGKLDVEVDLARELAMVKSDSIRNFTHKGIWPSSYSTEHPAKAMWQDLLYSPSLEQQELFCKILLLANWCNTHDIKLTVIQGYTIPWTDQQLDQLSDIIYNPQESIWIKYERSSYYKSEQGNTVPCLEFQFDLAVEIASVVSPSSIDKINHIQKQFKII